MHLPHILHSIHLHEYCLSQHDDGRLHRTAACPPKPRRRWVPQHYDLPGYVSVAAVPAAVPAAVTPTDSPFRFAFFPTLPQKAEAGGGGFMRLCREGSNRADSLPALFVHEGPEGDSCRGREEDSYRAREEDRTPADAYSRERISHRSGKMGVISVVARY